MKHVVSILFLFLIACAETITLEDVENLNGYWQIRTVTFPDNSQKTYEMSATLDFFQLESNKGYRKKVQPAADGTFDTSDDAISFEVVQREEGVFFVYSNTLDSWEEQLLHIDTNAFAVRNKAGIEYEYKRYQPLMPENE